MKKNNNFKKDNEVHYHEALFHEHVYPQRLNENMSSFEKLNKLFKTKIETDSTYFSKPKKNK